jgi:hypothetical protein
MSVNKQIEARLHRSLQNQIQVPRLGKAFDAAVWARIEALEAKATNPGALALSTRTVSRWLAITNLVGISATVAVAAYFALGSLGGLSAPALDLGMDVAMPTLTEDMVNKTMAVLGQMLGVVALLFGLSFTSVGRRLRASFS